MHILLSGCHFDTSIIWKCANLRQAANLSDRKFNHVHTLSGYQLGELRIWSCACFCPRAWHIENLIMRIRLSGWQLDKKRLRSCAYFCQVASLTNQRFDHMHTFVRSLDKSRIRWPTWQTENLNHAHTFVRLQTWEIENLIMHILLSGCQLCQVTNLTNREFDHQIENLIMRTCVRLPAWQIENLTMHTPFRQAANWTDREFEHAHTCVRLPAWQSKNVNRAHTFVMVPPWQIENLIMYTLLSGYQLDKSRIWSCIYVCQVATLTDREFDHVHPHVRLPTWQIENLIMRKLLSGCQLERSRSWSCVYFCLVANLRNREFDSCAHLCQAHLINQEFDHAQTSIRLSTWQIKNLNMPCFLVRLPTW